MRLPVQPLQRLHRRLVPNNSWGPTGVSTLIQPLNIFLERILTDALEDREGTVSIGGGTLTNLRFVDDIDGLAGEEADQAKLVLSVSKKPVQPTVLRSVQRRPD